MTNVQPNPYLRTKVMTASPAELRLMLFDGAIKYAGAARTGLAEKDYEATYIGITRCQNIVMELLNSLEPEHAPELCAKLSGLYTFLFTQLMNASRERDPGIIDEVIDLLQFERETWVLLMDRLRDENIDAAAVKEIPLEATQAPTTPGGIVDHSQRPAIGSTLSIQG